MKDHPLNDNGIPDFADGYNLLEEQYSIVTNIDNVVTNEHFVPIVFNIPDPIDLTKAKVKLTYDDSDPLGVTTNNAGEYVMPSGHLRIWTKDGDQERDGRSVKDDGHFLPSQLSGGEEYSAEDFGFTNGTRAVTYYLEGITNSQQVADQQILFEVDPDGDVPGQTYPGFIAADAVRVTVYDISWMDEEPNYSMKYPHSEPESDNFFLREYDGSGNPDYEDLDMYYRILPDELLVTNVVINIYQEDSSTVVTNILGEMDGGDFKTGDELHIQWGDARDSSGVFRSIGFYPIELIVEIDGVSDPVKTPIDDGDPDMACWQCPQTGLAIHDLVWKHRPILHVHAQEIGLPSSIVEFMIESGDATGPRVKEWTGGGTPTVHPAGTIPTSVNAFWDLFFDGEVTDGDLSDYEQWERAVLTTDPGEETVYHSANITDANNFAFLQFWMFENFSRRPFGILGMPFNPNVQHEGDMEHCQIAVRLADPNNSSLKAKWVTPFGATASQHYYAQTLKWDLNDGAAPANAHSQEHVEHVNNRLAIYVALGAHATYLAEDADIDVPEYGAHLGTQEQYDATPNGAYDVSAPANEIDYEMMHVDDILLGTFNGRWGYFDPTLTGLAANANGPSGTPHRAARDASGNAVNLRTQPRTLHNLSRKTSQATEMEIQ